MERWLVVALTITRMMSVWTIETSNNLKQGTCPASSAMSAIDGNIQTGNCQNDGDCAYELKCCPNRHGALRCVPPATTANEIIEGTDECPSATANCPINCQYMQTDSRCQSTCSNNNGCPPGRVCCLNSCGRFHCMDPNRERPGQCPATSHLNACSMYSSCIYDSGCGDNQKCCRVSTGDCTVETCMDIVEDVPIITSSCPSKNEVNTISYHECNDRTTCKDDLICCSNPANKGRCTEPPTNEQLANMRELNKEGVCPSISRCDPTSTCRADQGDSECPGTQKCCKDSVGGFCCQALTHSQPLNLFGEAKSNDLVARTYLLPFNYACATIVDQKINITAGQPITKFQFMMLPLQDLVHDKQATTYPPLRLQLWSPAPKMEGESHPSYTLVCEERIENPTSLPTQLLYEFDVSGNECFRNPWATDKVGFTFELYRKNGKDQTIIPVPYDYDNYWEADSGRTDYRMYGCENHAQPGDKVQFTSDANGFPGKWSYGVRQSSPSIVNIP